ncbi:MAG: C40 family peptidase [Anaerolineales bacterium]|nr:C40 family peptidase [Anaerolineales bacterium]
MKIIEQQLAELTKQCDNRLSVFDVEIANFEDDRLELSGCVLEKQQADELPRLFPKLKVDTASIRILRRDNLPRLSVATNLTGLYEKPTFGMPLSSELYFGTELEVLDEEKNWAFVRQSDGYLGWAHKPYLTEAPLKATTHLVIAPSVELRSAPQMDGAVISRLVSGTGVRAEKVQGEWSFVSANRAGWIPTAALRAIKNIPQPVKEKRALLLTDAARMIGVPYLWGGTSGNGIDCSGFARLLHRWVGMDIPRDADLQCQAAHRVSEPFEIGDLFFFGEGDSNRDVTHVGISLGGWKMIHSSRGNNGVYVDDLQEKESLRQIFMRAGSFLR